MQKMLRASIEDKSTLGLGFAVGLVGFPLLGITIDSKNIVEFSIGFLGIVGAISSVSVYLNTLSQKQLVATELAQLSARFQRLIDRNKVEIGALKMRVRDLEGFIQAQMGFNVRQEFPPASLPDEYTGM